MPQNFFRLDDDGVKLFLRVTPGASCDEITGVWQGNDGETRLGVKVAAPPDKGKANKSVIVLLAKQFGLTKSSVSVAAGQASRLKTVIIEGEAPTLHDVVRQLEAMK